LKTKEKTITTIRSAHIVDDLVTL